MSRPWTIFRDLVALGNTPMHLSGERPFDDWWHRVFGTNAAEPDPAALLESLQRQGFDVTGKFRGDDQGWFAAEIAYADGLGPLQVERYLAAEDDLRDDLNAWAAWLETCEGNPHVARLMRHMIQTTQLFTIRQPIRAMAAGTAGALGRALCQFLSRVTDGVYQVDGQGLFAADGTLLVDVEEGG